MSEGLPCFWQKLTEGRKRYDFTLTPLAGGAENELTSFCVADPQCQNTTNIRTFQQRNGTRHRRAGRSLDAAVLRASRWAT